MLFKYAFVQKAEVVLKAMGVYRPTLDLTPTTPLAMMAEIDGHSLYSSRVSPLYHLEKND